MLRARSLANAAQVSLGQVVKLSSCNTRGKAETFIFYAMHYNREKSWSASVENGKLTAMECNTTSRVSQAVAIQRLRCENCAHPQLIAEIEFNYCLSLSYVKACYTLLLLKFKY